MRLSFVDTKGNKQCQTPSDFDNLKKSAFKNSIQA